MGKYTEYESPQCSKITCPTYIWRYRRGTRSGIKERGQTCQDMEHKPNEKKRDARSSMHSMPTWFGITATLQAVSLGRYCPKKIANVKLKSLQIQCMKLLPILLSQQENIMVTDYTSMEHGISHKLYRSGGRHVEFMVNSIELWLL